MPEPTPADDDAIDDETEPEVEGFAVTPRDAASGLPTGKRMHKPFSLSLDLDLPAPVPPPVPPPS
jgi:hypothetical protein